MSTPAWDPSRYYPDVDTLDYPTDSVLGTVRPADAEAVVSDLGAAGVADDTINIVPSDRQNDFPPLKHGGIRGFFERLTGSLGGDLDLVRALNSDMVAGRVMVVVRVGGDRELRQRVADVLIRHDGRRVSFLGRQAIETLDGQPLA